MLKKITLSFLKTFKDFLILTIAQIIAAIFFFFVSFFVLKFLDINLFIVVDKNNTILIVLVILYLLFAGFVANALTRNRKGKKPI